jgi:thioredoxin-dependent peroxiredoxin
MKARSGVVFIFSGWHPPNQGGTSGLLVVNIQTHAITTLPSMKPALKKTAPDFTAPVAGGSYAEGSTLTLSQLAGKPVILYFYPKDDTPGCTKQACGLRDAWSRLQKKAHVFGISPDSVKSHAKFIAKHELPFPLISDADKAISEAYGVWVEKSMYGKKYMGVERSTFIIDKAGKLQAIFEKVKPEEHAEQVLAELG